MNDNLKANDFQNAVIVRRPIVSEGLGIQGLYMAKCFDRFGNLKWKDTIENLVTTVGKNLMLDTLLAGSSYTVTGPYMGLISSVGYSTIDAGDTMSSHSGWAEAGNGTDYPLYTGDRKTCAFSSAAAGAKALSAALDFVIVTTGGTVKGCFIVLGSGASATIADTGGTLYSAGLFTGGDKVVSPSDTLSVSYSTNLNA